MKKIFSILFALVLVVTLGLVTATPVLAGTIRYVPSQYSTIQAAINASSDGDTIMVAAGTYTAFQVINKTNISIIGTEEATVTTANLIEVGPLPGDTWVMAAVFDSENINIEGINFNGAGVNGTNVFGIAYVDSTGSITDLTVKNISGGDSGAGVAIIVTSTVEMKGATISNNDAIGIYVCDDSTLEAHFNKIVGNTDFGVVNDGGGTVDARYNWWGHASGPYHPIANPGGTGNAVSNNVNFVPWLEGVTETITNSGTVNARAKAATEVVVTGNATVTVFRYPANPGGDPPSNFGSLGKYIDVYVPDTSQVTQIEIRLYYTDAEVDEAGIDEESLRLSWWNGAAWVQCSDSGVNTTSIYGYSGYMWAKIRTDTTPKLEQLAGTPFGGYGQLPSPRPPSPTPPVTPRVKYDLTIDSTAGGSVATPSEGTFTYNKGTVVGLVATPDAGYRFVNWTVDVGTIADVNDATTTITMNGDYSIRANFVKQYDLTVSSVEGGSVTTPGKGMFTYDKGTVVNLVATPGAGYRFVNWTGNVSTIANVNAAATTITMNGDYSITANFIKQYNLTISSTIGGEVTTPSEGTFAYDEETVINLVAKPDKGYRFANWTGDVDTIANVNAATTTITMNADYSITANFEARVNWALLGGIIAAVVVAGLAIFFLLRRRRRAA